MFMLISTGTIYSHHQKASSLSYSTQTYLFITLSDGGALNHEHNSEAVLFK